MGILTKPFHAQTALGRARTGLQCRSEKSRATVGCCVDATSIVPQSLCHSSWDNICLLLPVTCLVDVSECGCLGNVVLHKPRGAAQKVVVRHVTATASATETSHRVDPCVIPSKLFSLVECVRESLSPIPKVSIVRVPECPGHRCCESSSLRRKWKRRVRRESIRGCGVDRLCIEVENPFDPEFLEASHGDSPKCAWARWSSPKTIKKQSKRTHMQILYTKSIQVPLDPKHSMGLVYLLTFTIYPIKHTEIELDRLTSLSVSAWVCDNIT